MLIKKGPVISGVKVVWVERSLQWDECCGHSRVTQGWLLCVTLRDTSPTAGEEMLGGSPGNTRVLLGFGDLVFFPDDLSSWGTQNRIRMICCVWDEKSLVCCGNDL